MSTFSPEQMVKKVLTICFLVFVIFVTGPVQPVTADESSEGNTSAENSVSEERITGLIDDLGAQFLSDRKKARKKLIEIGREAVPYLIEAVRSDGFRKRKASIAALGSIGDERALPVLVNGYLSGEPNIKKASRKAIIKFGSQSFNHMEEYIANHPQNGKKIKKLIDRIVRRKVENVLYGEVSEEGGVGYYDGQFQELESLGRRVIPVLKKIARREYNFEKYPPSPPPHVRRFLEQDYLSIMAINAIGRLGSEKDVSFLKSLSADIPALDSTTKVAASAMARLGEPELLNKLKKRVASSYEEALKKEDRFRIMRYGDEYSSLLSRTGDNKKAIDVYRTLLDIRERGIWWYNLACSHAQVGNKEKAIEALRNSYETNYRDAGWLKIDGDMDPLRDMKEFQEILNKMEKNQPERRTILQERDPEDSDDDKSDENDSEK